VGLPWEDQPVRYPPVLATLAKDHETNWREAAHAEVVRARDGLADRATFGGAPAARAFASVYAAAVAEYTETLRGIQDDLVTAAQNLALAAAEMRSRDENAGDAFVALLARWTDPAGFESVRLQEQARGTDEVVAGSATVTALDTQLRHDGTPLTTTDPAAAPTEPAATPTEEG
jgi:hypothetical protein